uniref:Putative u4/u6.u5 snrnp associated protein n=1 Tax=Lutzomyia longipalpis TaxID=7200 RepID=A0A7G3B1I9_LUTLO
MGSSKKHKRDRETRKHKKRSRTRSKSRSTSPSQERKHSKKHHKERRHHRRSAEKPREEYHSDSSDVIEVPVAPPAPIISNRRARSPSPIPEGGAGDCLSIEETNKLRAKLGLKPLEVDTGPIAREKPSAEDGGDTDEPELKRHKDDYGEFLHKPATNFADTKQAEKIREKIKERREKRQLENTLLKVTPLGASDEEDDLVSWVDRSREKEKLRKEAEMRAKWLEELEEQIEGGSVDEKERRQAYYGSHDLRGLRVEHDATEFTEGKTMILTLKDQDVLNEDGDTLVNVNLKDTERYRKNVENKKLKPQNYGYDCYSEEMDEMGQLVSRPILKKYDDEIDGGKKKSFTLGNNLQEEQEHKRKLLEIKCKLSHKRLETLNEQLIRPATDYYTEAEMAKFKKPKKKVKKSRRMLRADDLLPLPSEEQAGGSRDLSRRHVVPNDSMDVDLPPVENVKIEPEDDELEKMLSKARRLKQKESLISKPINAEEIKREVKSEVTSDDEGVDTFDLQSNQITLNATAEFCRTLGDIPTYGMAGNREDNTNDLLDFENEMEVEEKEPESTRGTWNSVNTVQPEAEENDEQVVEDVDEVAILDEEPDVSAGVAGALRLAVSKGYLERDDKNRPSNSRMAHLQAKNYSIEDKTYTEDDKFGRRDRYHSGPSMDFKEKDSFKPNVKLEYIDDSGRVLNAKEAFRYLSHKFHGKGPGKNKIEKRLKKSEQEGLMMKMSSTDTPLGTLNMLQAKQKETNSPYVVLSGTKQNFVGSNIVKHKGK